MGRKPKKEPPPFGRRLAHARLEKGWSQEVLAEKLGVSQQAIAYYERRAPNPNIDFVQRVAKLLDVLPDDLINGPPPDVPLRRRRGPKSKMEERLEKIFELPRLERRMLIDMIDSLIFHNEKKKKDAEESAKAKLTPNKPPPSEDDVAADQPVVVDKAN